MYSRNRLRDIQEMKEKFRQKYKLDIHYKYFPSTDNSADFLTRSITLDKFIFKFINKCKRKKEPPDPKHSDGSKHTASAIYTHRSYPLYTTIFFIPQQMKIIQSLQGTVGKLTPGN